MKGFFRELRRRRVFRTAALYVVGAWLVMQAADVFFPGWGLPDSAINVLLVAAVLGFPLALVFGWFFDVTTHGIVRTPSVGEEGGDAPLPLQRSDYVVLGLLVLIAAVIIYDATTGIVEAPRIEDVADRAEDLVPLETRPNSLVVLAFANISNDPDNDYFCDGVSEEIRNRLAANRELNVTGRESSRAFRDSDYGVVQIAELLGVEHIVQGSVRKSGERVRISVQLVDREGIQIWEESFDRILEDIFDIQDEIAGRVATTIASHVAPALRAGYEPPVDAYEFYLRGRELVYRRDEIEAIRQLRKAIELAPDYAQAHAEYAIANSLFDPTAEDLETARDAIDTALSLSPDLPRALAAQGLLYSQLPEPDFPKAERVLRRALELDPTMVDAMNWMSNSLFAQGKDDESEKWLRDANRIDPLHPTVAKNLADGSLRKGDYEAYEQVMRTLKDVPEPSWRTYASLRSLYQQRGRLVEMNALARERALRMPSVVHFDLALNYALLGNRDAAEYWTRRSIRDAPDWPFVPFYPSLPMAWRGDYADAAETFERILASRGETITERRPEFRLWLGEYQALAGDCAGAIKTLAGMLDDLGNGSDSSTIAASDAAQSLAWACGAEPDSESIRARLQELEESFDAYLQTGQTPRSQQVYRLARNAAVLGKTQLALERLEAAIDAGWADYYITRSDPRWTTLRDDPRFQALMDEVRAKVDQQRAVIEERDAAQDFPAMLDRVQASERQKAEHHD